MNVLNMVIPGETPAKKNSRISLKSGKNIPSKRYREWHETALLLAERQAMEQMGKVPTLSGGLEIWLSFFHGDKLRRDGDNEASSILDLLVDADIIADDNWQIVRALHVANFYDKGNARCEICIGQYVERRL